jgi:hypothetical protein
MLNRRLTALAPLIESSAISPFLLRIHARTKTGAAEIEFHRSIAAAMG